MNKDSLVADLFRQAAVLDKTAFRMGLPPGDNNLSDAARSMREAAALLELVSFHMKETEARELEVFVARPQFPILGSGGQKIDFALVADHGDQARKNHHQTVQRLAERGGLSWCELYAVLHNQPWKKMDQNEALIACRALEARYLAATRPAPSHDAAVVEGWRLVPFTPNLAMLNAAVDHTGAGIDMDWNGMTPQMMFRRAWYAMLAASPATGGA